ncbi:MAG: carboxyl transferase domain-containing protein [Bacteroidales bacterium]
MGSEEKRISEAIARNLYEFSDLLVPTITIITGEGASGGALGLGGSNRIYMMQNAALSVISPEGCESILFKDSSKAPKVAESLRLNAFDLYELGIVDKVI